MSSTTEKRVHLNDLHNDHELWLNKLAFCKQEIGILEHRMEDIAKRNTGKEVMAELEQFQNKFIRQREVIDELTHSSKLHESELAKESMDQPVAIDRKLFSDHTAHREEMDTFDKLYYELKNEFMQWLVKRM